MMKNESHLKSLLTGKGGVDSRQLEKIFAKCRDDKEKMRKLVRAFCTAYLIDNKQRPLRMRPMQEDIVLECLTNRKDGKQKIVMQHTHTYICIYIYIHTCIDMCIYIYMLWKYYVYPIEENNI